MVGCNLNSFFPLDFSLRQRHHNLVDDVGTTKPQAESLAAMDEVQDLEHDAAQMSSSQATFVPPRESQPPPSAQNSSTSMDVGHDGVDDHHAITTDRADGQTFEQLAKKNISFADALKQYQDKLDQEFLEFEQDLRENDPQDVVTNIREWDLLENEYQKEVGNVVAQEKDIMDAFNARFKVCQYHWTMTKD